MGAVKSERGEASDSTAKGRGGMAPEKNVFRGCIPFDRGIIKSECLAVVR